LSPAAPDVKRCHRGGPRHCVTVTLVIALDAVACPPTLLPSPSLLPPLLLLVSSPATLTHPCRRHHHHHPLRHHCYRSAATIVFVAIALAAVAIASSSPTTLITVAIPLATLTRPLRHPSPASLVTITIIHFFAFTAAIALVAVNCLPPSLTLLLPLKPSLSSSNSTLITNTITRFIPLTLFITRHPYPHLAALNLFNTCSHR